MPSRRKRLYRRLESKFRYFTNRVLIAALLFCCLLFLAGLAFSVDSIVKGGFHNPLLNLAFVSTGVLAILIATRFGLGAMRAKLDRDRPKMLWQIASCILLLAYGIWIIYFALEALLAP